MHWSQVYSSLIVLALLIGSKFHKRRQFHQNWMLITIVLDLALVIYLTLARQAVSTALDHAMGQAAEPAGLLPWHISCAFLSIVGYVIAIFLGFALKRGQNQYRIWHKRNAYAVLFFRILTLITAFFIPLKG